jgi:hypothetical protein
MSALLLQWLGLPIEPMNPCRVAGSPHARRVGNLPPDTMRIRTDYFQPGVLPRLSKSARGSGTAGGEPEASSPPGRYQLRPVRRAFRRAPRRPPTRTDGYLLGLAIYRKRKLATMDRAVLTPSIVTCYLKGVQSKDALARVNAGALAGLRFVNLAQMVLTRVNTRTACFGAGFHWLA